MSNWRRSACAVLLLTLAFMPLCRPDSQSVTTLVSPTICPWVGQWANNHMCCSLQVLGWGPHIPFGIWCCARAHFGWVAHTGRVPVLEGPIVVKFCHSPVIWACHWVAIQDVFTTDLGCSCKAPAGLGLRLELCFSYQPMLTLGSCLFT